MTLCVVAVVVLQSHVAAAKTGGFDWNELNCSAQLHIPLKYPSEGEKGRSFSNDSLLKSSLSPSLSPEDELNSTKCPPWYRYNPQSKKCSFASSIHGRISYVVNTLQTAVLQCYCMTNDSRTHELAVGACFYTCLVDTGYYTLPCNVSTVQEYTCDRYQRKGVSCGDCASGYAPSVYSYTSHCVPCMHVNLAVNWIKYLIMAFVPLTLFTIFVIVFRVRATSPYLFSYIFIVQTVAMTLNMRFLQTLVESNKIHSSYITTWGISLLSFWNLDFFRMHYTPFCLHPEMTTLQAYFMDYFIALYPLLLVVVIALFVELGIGRTRFGEVMWTPLGYLYTLFGVNWNMRSNLISAFATFIFLSNQKILSTAFDMLLPAYVYPINEAAGKRMNVYSSGTIEYFSREHAPYAVCSMLIVTVLVTVPMLVLLLYPFAFCRRALGKLRLDSNAVRLFASNYQESYKNRREDNIEYRWFPLSYFILRILLLLLYGATLSSFFYPMAGVVLTAFVVFLAVCRPRKSEVHNAIDVFHVMCFLIFILGIMANITANSQTKRKEFLSTSIVIIAISSCLPLFYFFGLLGYFLLFQTGLVHIIRRRFRRHGYLPFQRRRKSERIIDYSANYGSTDSLPDRFVREEDYEQHIFVPKPNTYTSTYNVSDSIIN